MRDARLWKILALPQHPVERPFQNDWLEAERRLCPLPEDFKGFLTDYGTGSIDGFVWLFNPASQNTHLNLIQQVDRQVEALKSSFLPDVCIYPDDRGVLPFGITDNGDVLCWQVHGDAETWQVVVIDSRAPTCKVFEVGFSGFMAGILLKELVCDFFPNDFPSDDPAFGCAK